MATLRRKPTSLSSFLWEDYLKPLHLTPHEVAHGSGISKEMLDAILYHDAPIDQAISEMLGAYFLVDPTFFFNVDHSYHAFMANTQGE